MTARRPRPAAVLFDNDGLTLDTEVVWSRAEAALFARHGVTFTDRHKRELLGTAEAAAARTLERQLDAPGQGRALMAELHELMTVELSRAVEPRLGAVALLDALQAAGVPVGMASNSPRALVDLALRSGGLEGRFAHIVAGDEVSRPKPAPDVYLALAAALGVAAADCVALEDSPTGAAAARAAGAFVIGVPSMPDMVIDADLVADSLAHPAVHARLGV